MYGVASGAFSVFCPKYISEVAPVEIKGTAGSLTQICVTFGILLSFCLGSLFTIDSPDPVELKSQQKKFINVMYLIPIGVTIINVILLVFVFPFDTPPVLKQKGEYAKLNTLMGRIYKPYAVQSKIDELQGGESDDDQNYNISYGEVFCSPYFRRSTYIGIALAAF